MLIFVADFFLKITFKRILYIYFYFCPKCQLHVGSSDQWRTHGSEEVLAGLPNASSPQRDRRLRPQLGPDPSRRLPGLEAIRHRSFLLHKTKIIGCYRRKNLLWKNLDLIKYFSVILLIKILLILNEKSPLLLILAIPTLVIGIRLKYVKNNS